jgi:hypothetical protein
MSPLMGAPKLESIVPEMTLRSFNKLKLSKSYLKTTRPLRAKHSQGVNDVYRRPQTLFFTSRNKLWKNGKVVVKNNLITSCILLNSFGHQKKCSEVFRQLLESYGNSYSIHPITSFNKAGRAFEWNLDTHIVSFRVIPMPNEKWSYQFNLKPIPSDQKSLFFVPSDDSMVKHIKEQLLGITNQNYYTQHITASERY